MTLNKLITIPLLIALMCAAVSGFPTGTSTKITTFYIRTRLANTKDQFLTHIVCHQYQNDTLQCFPHQPVNHRNETLDAEESFIWFSETLKSFISDTHFDTFRFDTMAQKLAQDLEDIISISREVVPGNKLLSDQLSFIQRMFHIMRLSAIVLQYYDHVGSPENYVLNRVFDLNVRILRLYTPHGQLDWYFPQYAEKIAEYQDLSTFWRQNTKLIDCLPKHMERIISEEIHRGQEMLKELDQQVQERILSGFAGIFHGYSDSHREISRN